MRFLDSVPISHFYLDLLYLHFYCYILFSLLLLLEVFPQCGVLSWKGAVAGEFNEYMGTRLLHSLQIWPSALTVSDWSSGQNLPSFSCYLQISPVCFLVSFSWLFCGSSVLSVIRHPTTTFSFFVHRCWYHSAPLALDCLSFIAYTWHLRWYLVIIFFQQRSWFFPMVLLSSCFVYFCGYLERFTYAPTISS